MILDVGCGDIRKGDIGVDVRRTKSVDVLADVRFLPFKNEAFEQVYSSEVIEHFSHRETINVLTEWSRVLKKQGILEIECPDLRARAFLFFLNPTRQNIENIYGGQDYETNYHKSGFTYEMLKSQLELCGIVQVKRIIKGYKGIPFIPDCLHIRGIKP